MLSGSIYTFILVTALQICTFTSINLPQQNQHRMNNQSINTARSAHKHPTIPSNTHYAYPFPKTPRFPNNNPPCPQAFYSYHSQLSTRKAGLGFGKKTDFQKLLPNNPPSNRYNIKSIFENGISRGVSFGCSRQKSPDRSYLIPQIHHNPGPGNYENQVQTRMKQEYSLRSKTIDIHQKLKTPNFTPGPGAYQSVDFQSNGRTRLSKYSGSKLGNIDSNTERFPQIKNTPGPGEYHNEGGNIALGKYTLSRHTGKGDRVFSREVRFTGQQWRRSNSPGPANYQVPGSFGQRGSSVH